jgi:flagellar hook assembly protein FlgD
VDVAVFDLGGRRVRTIARGNEPAGTRTLRWDGRDERGGAAPAGLYFMRARAGGAAAEIKLVRTR